MSLAFGHFTAPLARHTLACVARLVYTLNLPSS